MVNREIYNNAVYILYYFISMIHLLIMKNIYYANIMLEVGS